MTLPFEVSLAKGGGDGSASVADAMVAGPFLVNSNPSLGNVLHITATAGFAIELNFDQTVSQGTSQCWPGTNGATPTQMAELLAKLDESVALPRYDFHADASSSAVDTTGGIIIRWMEGNTEFFMWLGESGRAPNSVKPTVSKTENVYTYFGGTIYLNRAIVLNGKKKTNAGAIVCPNQDQILLTWPLP
jgi:hypothetical protein